MSKWLEQRNVWQYFVISLVSATIAVLVGSATVVWLGYGHLRFELVAFGPPILAAAATLGRQMRKRAARAHRNQESD